MGPVESSRRSRNSILLNTMCNVAPKECPLALGTIFRDTCPHPTPMTMGDVRKPHGALGRCSRAVWLGLTLAGPARSV